MELGRRYVFTFTTCVLLVAAFVLVEVPGANVEFLLIGRGELPPGVVQFGLWPPAVIAGEYWRLLTSTLLHAGLYHLLLNAIGLLGLGMLAESRFGTRRLAAIAIGAALAGSLASLLVIPRGLSLGASGAIMGIAGALVSLVVRFRLERRSLAWVLGVSAATVLNGFLDARVNNAAHIGGFVAGLALAWMMGAEPAWVRLERRAERAVALSEEARVRELVAKAAEAEPLPQDVSRDPSNRATLRPGLGVRLLSPMGILLLGATTLYSGAQGRGSLMLLSALMTVAMLVATLYNWTATLTLTPVGPTFRSGLPWASFRCRWADVDRFETHEIRSRYRTSYVVYCYILGQDREGVRLVRKTLPALAGMKGDALVAYLEEWRRRWAPARSRGRSGRSR